MRLFTTLLLLVTCSAQANTGTNEGGASLFTGDYLFQVVGSLLLVIFALLAVMMLLKRFNSVGSSTGGYIQVLASAPLGQRERAVLLQVGTDQVLVGVSAGNVATLHKFAEPVVQMDDKPSLSFKEVWNFARNRQGGEE